MKCLVLLLICASPAYGAQITGNGGDAVYCREPLDDHNGNQQSEAELLDFYEGRVLRGLIPDFEGLSDVDAMVHLLLHRVSDVDLDLARTLTDFYQDFLSSSIIVPDVVLLDIPDVGNLPLDPVRCTISQVAVQRVPRYPDDKRYVISGDIWNSFSAADKAGLIFHEIVYRRARVWGHLHSQAVRYFVAKVAAGDIHTMDATTYAYWRDEIFIFKQAAAWFDERTENFWWFSNVEMTQAELQLRQPCRQLGPDWDGPTASDFRGASEDLMTSPLKATVWARESFSFLDQMAHGYFWTATGQYSEFSGRPLEAQRYACLKKESL